MFRRWFPKWAKVFSCSNHFPFVFVLLLIFSVTFFSLPCVVVQHLGDSVKTLDEIASGKHPFSKVGYCSFPNEFVDNCFHHSRYYCCYHITCLLWFWNILPFGFTTKFLLCHYFIINDMLTMQLPLYDDILPNIPHHTVWSGEFIWVSLILGDDFNWHRISIDPRPWLKLIVVSQIVTWCIVTAQSANQLITF